MIKKTKRFTRSLVAKQLTALGLSFKRLVVTSTMTRQWVVSDGKRFDTLDQLAKEYNLVLK